MKVKILFLLLCCPFLYTSYSQDKILVFTKTNGFRHGSIDAGITMITNLGNTNGLWTTEQTNNSDDFTASNLSQYKAIIWCNTSGNNLLNNAQQQAFENFITNGGGFLGIHAATDTYRDKSWPFYNDLVGAIVQSGPNHTSNNFNATMTITNSHPSVDFLGTSWNKSEEYYYWKNNGGQLYANNINLLIVESTGSNDYDESRPISWYKEFNGGRSFYTALGHNSSDYTDNLNFIKHIEEGIKYVIGNTLNIETNNKPTTSKITQNPVNKTLNLQISNTSDSKKLIIYTIEGRQIRVIKIKPGVNSLTINVEQLSKGLYIGKLTTPTLENNFRFIKE